MSYTNLDLNLIKTFLAVYDCKSILLASKKLFISQPAITKSIKRLESFLGAKLFIRTSRGVLPTIEGEEFNKTCYNSSQIINAGINRISSIINLENGTINIGSSSTIMRKLLLPFIKYFNKKYSNIVLTITDANSNKLQKYTYNGTVDLSILSEPIDDEKKFKIIPITVTHDCLIAPYNYEKDYLSFEELKKERIILQKRPSNNRGYVENLCIDNNVILTPNLEIGSFGLITDFVANELGLAFTVKEFIEDDIKNKRVKIIKTDFNIKPRNICIITPLVAVNSYATEKFIEELKKYFKPNV